MVACLPISFLHSVGSSSKHNSTSNGGSCNSSKNGSNNGSSTVLRTEPAINGRPTSVPSPPPDPRLPETPPALFLRDSGKGC